MSFFKSAKYKLGGSSSKRKVAQTNTKAEVFQKINNTPYYEVEKTSKTKGKAPPKPTDVVSPKENIKACFRMSNKTPYLWKLKSQDNVGFFPNELNSSNNKLVQLMEGQKSAAATYVLVGKDIEKETDELNFEIKVVEKNDDYELVIDWQNLSTLEGIQFRPDSTTSGAPVKLSTNELLVEIESQ